MAMLMLTLSVTALALMSGRWVVPAILWVVSLASLIRRFRVPLRWSRRLILRLLLAVAFAAVSQVLQRDFGSLALSALSMLYITPLYFLTLMTLELFLQREGPLPSAMVLYATIVMIFAGGLSLEQGAVSYLESGRLFLGFALALAGMAMAYLSAARRSVGLPAGRAGVRNVAAGVTLVVALAAAAGASELVSHYKKEIYEKLTLWAALVRGGRQVGFDEQSRLRSMTNIRTYNGQEVALRVQSPGAPGYLRGRAYVLFNKDRWSNPDDWRTLLPWPNVAGVERPSENWNLFMIRRDPQGPWSTMTVHPAALRTAAVFMPLGTQVAVVPTQKLREDPGQSLSASDILEGSPYVLYRPQSDPPHRSLSPQERKDCLALPDDMDVRVRIESRLVLKDCRTTTEALRTIERYFETNFQYHLGVSIPDKEDPLGYFLSEKPPAHCEMFASAAAIMLRCHGIPTRYVTGFVASERNPYSDYWVARNADAHAWVEAWDAQRGWVLVEPTPPAGVPGLRQEHGALAYFWDILGFHVSRLLAMVQLEGLRGLLVWVVDMLMRLLSSLLTRQGLTSVGGLVILIAIWRALVRHRSRQNTGWRRARTELDAVLAAADRRVKRLGLRRRHDETLARFVKRLQRTAAHIPPGKTRQAALARWAVGWYNLYQKARYSGTPSRDEIQILRSQIPRRFSTART